MYIVTVEDEEGMWFDDPQGFDTLPEARKHFNNLQVKGAASFVIYECHQIDFREPGDEVRR